MAFILLQNFKNSPGEIFSPWWVDLASPLGFCHVTLQCPKTALSRHGDLRFSENLWSLELFRLVFSFLSPRQVHSPSTRCAKLQCELEGELLEIFRSGELDSFPAQLDQVRHKMHNRAFYHIFMAFPWITCETSNQKCLKIYQRFTTF